ncbi:DRTGG domain-containing protein [Sporolactobacillus nakayamae]|uniref:Predicted transcriptional regulator containing CBS domains n=1 Tax=Sporolactobacillus nakayamae TaxID=269670 RepID=A0A1I2RUX9_9BACL|nr:DRTGG domain-containing protein [Sporolactobacillus nakayamae]SFG43319.1 Predicted transcriptional regulator containing CBS domains [Sporolactobacillus nakayamae]
METKHDQILKYIADLEIGSKISVRQTAKVLQVSEGTAYRAIKDAENQGLVSTVERVGTIRIERKTRESIEKLTFDTVVNIVDGQVLGGKSGLSRTLNHFVIGAMEINAMKRYIGANDLMIVGNRESVHEYALKEGAAVLITGGFNTSERVKLLADQTHLPVITTSYDTFTVAAKINRAIYDQLIKKEIVHVSDIMIPFSETQFVFGYDSPKRWHELNHSTAHSRFPVVDQQMKVIGIVAMKDIIRDQDVHTIEEVMTSMPLVVNPTTSVAAAAHRMIWEGIDGLPVVDEQQHLLGMITRRDVLKALQMIQQQPQMGETIEDIVSSQLKDYSDDNNYVFQFNVTPQMSDYLGSVSHGVMTSMITTVCRRVLNHLRRSDLVVDNLSFYFFKPVQLEQTVTVQLKILEMTRRNGKMDIELFVDGQLCGKALLNAQFIDRY